MLKLSSILACLYFLWNNFTNLFYLITSLFLLNVLTLLCFLVITIMIYWNVRLIFTTHFKRLQVLPRNIVWFYDLVSLYLFFTQFNKNYAKYYFLVSFFFEPQSRIQTLPFSQNQSMWILKTKTTIYWKFPGSWIRSQLFYFT